MHDDDSFAPTADRDFDAALGRALEEHRRLAGLSCDDVARRTELSMDEVEVAGLESAAAGMTPGRVLVLAKAADADPLALMAEALAAAGVPEPPVGGTTRVVHALNRLHPSKRELLHALILAFGET